MAAWKTCQGKGTASRFSKKPCFISSLEECPAGCVAVSTEASASKDVVGDAYKDSMRLDIAQDALDEPDGNSLLDPVSKTLSGPFGSAQTS